MKKTRLLTALLLICSLLALTACDAAPQEQTTTTAAATAQTVTAETTETVTTTASTTTVAPAEIKPIRSIFLYSYNAYAASSAWFGYNFFYFTPELIAWGRTMKTPINTDDPLSTENVDLMLSKAPGAGIFEALCEEMWELRFDLLPEQIERPEPMVNSLIEGSDYYLTVTFEDGSVLTSSGYAATHYNRTYKQLADLLYAYAERERADRSHAE